MSIIGDLSYRLGIDTTGWVSGLHQAESQMERFGTRMFFLGSRITAGLGVPLALAAGSILKVGASFDQAMTESLAIIDHVTPRIRKQMEDLALTMSTQTKFSAEELAEAYFFLASSGLDAAESMEALPVVARFAQAGVMDLARATELLSDAYIALGMRSSDPIKNMENMQRVADVLTEANNRAQGTVEQFAEALANRAAPAFRIWGVSVEEGVAALAAFAERGVKGLKAGRQMFIVLRDLQRAAAKNSEVWKEMNIHVFDEATEKFNPLADILEQLHNALEKGTDLQKRHAFTMLGLQERSLQATLALLGFHDRIRELNVLLDAAGGVMQRVADKQMLSFTNQLGLLKDRLVKVGIELFKAFEPTLRDSVMPLLKSSIDLIGGFTSMLGAMSPGMQKAVTAFVAFGIALGPIIIGIGVTSLALRGMGPIFLAIPKMVNVAAGAFAIFNLRLFKITTGTIQARNSLGQFTKKLTIMNTGILSTITRTLGRFIGPWGTLATVIGIAGAAIIGFKIKNEAARQAFVAGAREFTEKTNAMDIALKTWIDDQLGMSAGIGQTRVAVDLLSKSLGISSDAWERETKTSADALDQIDRIIAGRKELVDIAAEEIRVRRFAAEEKLRDTQKRLDEMMTGQATMDVFDLTTGIRFKAEFSGKERLAEVSRLEETVMAQAALVQKLTDDLERLGKARADDIELVSAQTEAIRENIEITETEFAALSDLGDVLAENSSERKKIRKELETLRDTISGEGLARDLKQLEIIWRGLQKEESISEQTIRRVVDAYTALRDKTKKSIPELDKLATRVNTVDSVMVKFIPLIDLGAAKLDRMRRFLNGSASALGKNADGTIRATSTLAPYIQLVNVGVMEMQRMARAAETARIEQEALDEEIKIAAEQARASEEAFRHLTQSLGVLSDIAGEGIFGAITRGVTNVVGALSVASESITSFNLGMTQLGEGGQGFTGFANIVAGVTGIVGAVATGISLAIKLFESFGRSIEDNVAITVERWGVTLSEGLIESIADASRAGLSDIAAIMVNLGRVFEEAGGVMAFGLAKAITKTRDLFVMLDTKQLTVQQVGAVFDDVFGQILPNAIDKATGLVRQDFLELIALARQFGVESAAMAEFIVNQAVGGASALSILLRETTKLSADKIQVASNVAIKFFNAAIASGQSFSEVMAGPIGDAIASIPTTLQIAGKGFKQVIEEAAIAGEILPGTLEPYLAKLQELGLATSEEIAQVMSDLVIQTTADWKSIQSAAERYGVSLEKLGPAFDEARLAEAANQIAKDFNILSTSGGDIGDVLNNMRDEVIELILESKELGVALPSSMKPVIRALIEAGLLVDETGTAIADMSLSSLNFADTATEQFDRVIETLLELAERTGIDLPKSFLIVQEAAKVAADEITGPFVDAAVAAGDVLVSLANLAALDEEAFQQMGGTVLDSFNALIEGGVSGEAALLALVGPIGTLIALQDQYGFKLDEGTQGLLDMARESGITGVEGKDAFDKIATALESVAASLKELVESIVPGFVSSLDTIPSDVDVDINLEVGDIPDINIPPVHVPIRYDYSEEPPEFNPETNSFQRSFAMGGVVPGAVGSPLIAKVHGGEIITSVNERRTEASALMTLDRRLESIERLLKDQPRKTAVAISDMGPIR